MLLISDVTVAKKGKCIEPLDKRLSRVPIQQSFFNLPFFCCVGLSPQRRAFFQRFFYASIKSFLSLAMVENNRRALSMCEYQTEQPNQALSTTDNLACRASRGDDACKIMDLVSLKREGNS